MNPSRLNICVLWILLIIGMILHFNYHISGIVYGIDVRSPAATGIVPPTLVWIRILFYLLPMVFTVTTLYFDKKGIAWVLFCISILYAAAHLFHVIKEIQKHDKDYSQISLLILVFALAIMLCKEHYRWIKSFTAISTQTK